MQNIHYSFEDWHKYNRILDTFRRFDISISEFLKNLILYDDQFQSEHAFLITDLFHNAGSILLSFARHNRSMNASAEWSLAHTKEIFKGELLRLADKSTGFHFNAANAKARPINDFASGRIITRVATIAPHFWSFMQGILRSRASVEERGTRRQQEKVQRLFDIVSKHFTIYIVIRSDDYGLYRRRQCI